MNEEKGEGKEERKEFIFSKNSMLVITKGYGGDEDISETLSKELTIKIKQSVITPSHTKIIHVLALYKIPDIIPTSTKITKILNKHRFETDIIFMLIKASSSHPLPNDTLLKDIKPSIVMIMLPKQQSKGSSSSAQETREMFRYYRELVFKHELRLEVFDFEKNRKHSFQLPEVDSTLSKQDIKNILLKKDEEKTSKYKAISLRKRIILGPSCSVTIKKKPKIFESFFAQELEI